MLEKNDEKVIAKIVQGVIDKSVTPKFDTVTKRLDKMDKKIDITNRKLDITNRKLDATMEMTAKNTEDIVMMNEKFDEQSEKMDDLQLSFNRVETLVTSEIKYVDDLSDRVITLEKAHK